MQAKPDRSKPERSVAVPLDGCIFSNIVGSSKRRLVSGCAGNAKAAAANGGAVCQSIWPGGAVVLPSPPPIPIWPSQAASSKIRGHSVQAMRIQYRLMEEATSVSRMVGMLTARRRCCI